MRRRHVNFGWYSFWLIAGDFNPTRHGEETELISCEYLEDRTILADEIHYAYWPDLRLPYVFVDLYWNASWIHTYRLTLAAWEFFCENEAGYPNHKNFCSQPTKLNWLREGF